MEAALKVVVTGGSGLLGVAVIRELVGAGATVLSLDRKPHPDGHRPTWTCDLRDAAQLYQACVGADSVVHLAAHIAPNLTSDTSTFNENVSMTYNVLKAAQDNRVRRVVLASSVAAYGYIYGPTDLLPHFLPLTEEHPLAASDPYGLSKQIGELLGDAFARRGAMSVVSLRLPGINYDPTFERIQSFMSDPAYRKSGFWTYVDARDAARAFRLSVEKTLEGHRIYNIAAPSSNMREPTVDLVRRFLPGLSDIREISDKNWSGMSSARAASELGFVAEHVWEQILR